jgi:predicted ATPase
MDIAASLIEAQRAMAAQVGPRRHELGVPASRFIGREADLLALDRLFREGRRLVTVWGPAGMGKTRLAVEFALAHARAQPDDELWMCELQEARDLLAVVGKVARALGATVAAGEEDAGTVARIGRFLAAQGPALLVLDNLEQVIEPAALALDAWVRAAPDVRFLATSRERTRLPGEVTYELTTLGLSGKGGGGTRSEAALLFADRVNGQSPRRPIDPSSPLVEALVTKLEGIPLAIELAAARAEVLGLPGLLARLSDRLDLLDGGLRGVEARQTTMRDAVAWSWELLDEPDRRALARCSVFRGGFTLAACEGVLGASALARIQSLRDKSLLRAVPGAAAGVRFSLYEVVRQLASDKLDEHGERELAEVRHAAFYLADGEMHAAAWEKNASVEALDHLTEDLENLLAVVERAMARAATEASAGEALRALMVIDPVLATRGPFGMHLELLGRALATAEGRGVDPLLAARALAARGRARQLRGQAALGLDDLERAERRAHELGAIFLEATILTELGLIHHQRRDLSRASACYERALALHRQEGDRRAEARALANLGALHHDEGRFDEAMRRYEAAIGIAEAAGDRRAEGITSGNAGLIEQERGAAAQARRRYERAIAVLEQVGDIRLLAITIGNLGVLHHEEGRLDEARQSHARAAGLLADVGDPRSEALARGRLGAALAAQGRTEEARAAMDRGDRLLGHLDDPLAAAVLAVMRGFLDLALARSAVVEARPSEAADHVAAARGRIAHALEGAPSLANRSDDVRLALRILERSLPALDASASPPDGDLLLAREGRWCRPPGGAWQDLRERHAARRLLVCLVERQRAEPGRGIAMLELQEAGWPGERILPAAAANRIYVALNQLRKIGLKDWLKRNAEGYYLDPALPVHHTSIEPIRG